VNARDGKWFQKQAAAHREEIRALRKLVLLFANELDTGGLSGQLLARELRTRLKTVRET